MKKSDSLFFELSKAELIILFVYYTIILIAGGVTSIITLCQIEEETSHKQLIIETIISSLSISVMLCSLQYIKRLYKACITNRIIAKTTFAGHIGTLVYFLLRPLYAFTFVIVMIFAILSGLFVVTGNLDYIINERFLYLCVILSSFIGYSVGHLLDKFEKLSKEKIDKIIKEEG